MISALRTTIIAATVALAIPSAFAGALPDPKVTPGAINPNVTQDNIHQTICVKGWTKTVRPPTSFTRALKLRQIDENDDLADYEEDHLIPLSIGGAPADRRNLWAQRWHGEWGAYSKDRLEIRLQHLVCSGKLPLAEAQAAIAHDWVEAYHRFCPTQSACPSWRDLHPDD
jgi:hypothetical protein